jgi:hypothetical protein
LADGGIKDSRTGKVGAFPLRANWIESTQEVN